MKMSTKDNIKYTNDFRTKIINMGQKIKLTLFVSLMILANLAKAQETTTTYSLVTEGTTNEDVGNLIVEKVNDVKEVDGIIENSSPVLETQTSETDIASESPNTVESITETTTLTPTTSYATESSNELKPATESETVNDQIDCVCNCSANGSSVQLECSTQVPEETQTDTTPNSENENSETNTLEPDTTNPEETSTPTNENPDTTTKSQTTDDTTTDSATNENTETTPEPTTTTTTTTVPPPCSTPGIQPHDLDCKQYYDCTSEGFLDGTFHWLAKSCPNKQVFNRILNRCSRDVSSCSNPVECLVKGGVADPSSNTSYYLCEPRLIGGGFYIFHIECPSNEIFYPALGKCFIDLNNLPTQVYPPYYNWNTIQDIDIVKAELKLLKEQDKLKLKQDKELLKAEQKLQKELEKAAKKRAKDEAKLNIEKAKMESLNFVCAAEGNFASTVAEDIYYACITKKDKFKVLVMQCPIDSKFHAATGICLRNVPTNNNNVYETDDDDADDE